MRTLFKLFWLLAAPLLLASCNEDDLPAPEPYAELSAEVLFSTYTNNGYLPVGRTNEMKVYSGDTIRYFFRFSTNQGIRDFKVYDNVRGREWPLIVQKKASSESNGVMTQEYELHYLVDSHVPRMQPGQEIILTVEPEVADGSIYKLPDTGEPLEIKFTLAAPLEYKGVKLYNYWGPNSNSLVINDFRIDNPQPQALVEERLLNPFAFLTNKMPPRDWFDNRFEASFTSGPSMGEGNVAFVKVPAGGKEWYQPNQMALAMKQYGPEKTTVLNAQVGDVYAFRVRYPLMGSWVVYGVLEVKNLVDDHKTADTGGHDNDYLELDIKYFPGYRY